MNACSRYRITILTAEWLHRVLLGVSMLALIFCLGVDAASADDPAPVHNQFHGWWELGGYYGSDDASRGEVTIFTPLAESASSLFFADLRGKFFKEDAREGNFALGYRRMLTSGWNLGIWSGLDVRSTETDNKFWQASGGIEALSERWDFRANGYVPLSDPKTSPSLAEVRLSGNSIFMIGGEEVPLHGVDGEIGFKLFGGHRGGGNKDGVSHGRHTELRVYGGGFWFDADEALKQIAGPRARIEFRIQDILSSMPGSRLTLESEYSHDDVRDDKWEIGARLRIPFGGLHENHAPLSAQQRRMTEGLERDTDIVTAASEAENVIDDATDVAINQVAIANSAASVANGVNQGANTLIIVQGASAQIDVSASDGQALQASQTVQGGGSTIKMRGSRTGIVSNFTAPGARPTLFSNDNNNVTGIITAASNTHIAGLTIQGQPGGGNGNVGIRGDSINSVVIERNSIMNTGGNGVELFNNNSNAIVLQNTITNISNGVFLSGSNSNVTVSENMISTTANDGILIRQFNTNVRISGNTFTTIGSGDAADDVITFFSTGNSLTEGSTGNVLTSAPNAGIICRGTGFTGTLQVTDQTGALQTFTNGC